MCRETSVAKASSEPCRAYSRTNSMSSVIILPIYGRRREKVTKHFQAETGRLIHRQPRHVLNEEIDRRAAFHREKRRLEDRGSAFEPETGDFGVRLRSEEHTSELQSQFHLVCRLLLE